MKIKRTTIKKRLIFASMDYLFKKSLINMIFFYNYNRKIAWCFFIYIIIRLIVIFNASYGIFEMLSLFGLLDLNLRTKWNFIKFFKIYNCLISKKIISLFDNTFTFKINKLWNGGDLGVEGHEWKNISLKIPLWTNKRRSQRSCCVGPSLIRP